MPASAYTSSRRLSGRQLHRLLHDDSRRAEKRWDERQGDVYEEFDAAFNKILDGERDVALMREQRLLLVVGTICLANGQPGADIWRQIYEAYAEVPQPSGDVALLDELAGAARRGKI